MTGAPSEAVARKIGKEIVNSPLFKCAIAGNDPNVGRLLAVVGRVMGILDPDADMSKTRCVCVRALPADTRYIQGNRLAFRGLVSVCYGSLCGAVRICNIMRAL